MDIFKSLKSTLFDITPSTFNNHAIQLFRFQLDQNIIYRQYVDSLGIDPAKVTDFREIPFLPIQLFKQHSIKSGNWEPEVTFESSGTTSSNTSSHSLQEVAYYHRVSATAFERIYGPLSEYHILALLPSYLERSNSSLVAMVEHFIARSGSSESGFYLDNQSELMAKLDSLAGTSRRILLIGVSFALLDLAQSIQPGNQDLIVMETGGMKGRREELTREDLHQRLSEGFGVHQIHSEYGMTELLSQAYSRGGGVFETPPWMRVLIRDIYDPFQVGLTDQTGAMNIIDLANVHSCAFIETQDLGRVDGTNFQVLGRVDNSDLRGCNLLLN